MRLERPRPFPRITGQGVTVSTEFVFKGNLALNFRGGTCVKDELEVLEEDVHASVQPRTA